MNFREEKDCLELTLSLCTLSRWKVEPSPACRSSYQVPSFQQLSEVLIASSVCTCNHLCTKAPLRRHWPCHNTVYTTSLLLVVFSALLHPFHNFSDQCSVLFSGVSDGSVMAVCYLKGKLRVAFCSLERYFC